MIRNIFLILCSVLIAGCELIVIGTKQDFSNSPVIVDFNQKTPMGAFFLFKTELDSNNVPGATDLMAKSDGKNYLAIERYEMYYKIHRYRRMMFAKEITNFSTDTISNASYRFKIEFEFNRKLFFVTSKIENKWFITELGSYE